MRLSNSLLIFMVFWLMACEPSPPTVMRSPVGKVPATPQRSGDPENGYRVLTEVGYVRCGVPMTAYRAATEPPSPAQRIPRDAKHADLPYSLTAWTNSEGVELAVSNCLSCHAAMLNGELVIGLGNESMDWTQDIGRVAESFGRLVTGDAAGRAWAHWADRMNAIAPFVQTATVGVNPANNLTMALFTHRDARTLAWSETPLIEPPRREPLPVSVPPWWILAKKNAMFYSAQARGDFSRFIMTAMLFCTDSVDEAREIDALAPDLLAYLRSLTPPPYPFPINAALAEQGEVIYQRDCAGCHGVGDDYPNLVIDLEEVGTDPALALEAYEEWDRFTHWHNASFFGEISHLAPARGYIAPPLDGIWATAPYFHNGSVPTLDAVLSPTTRPRFWTRDFADSTALDRVRVGWQYETLTAAEVLALSATEQRRLYDTTRRGYGNQGHGYGEGLSEAERRALLEYLKTL